MTRRGAAPIRLVGAVVGIGLQWTAAAPAAAALWTVDHTVQARLDLNDNPALDARPGAASFRQQFGGTLAAARQAEHTATRLDLSATLTHADRDALPRRVGASLGLGQTWSQPRDLVNLSLQWQQTQTDDPSRGSLDLGLGRGWRRALAAGAGWTHALSETSAVQWSLSAVTTQHGSNLSTAVDYRNSTLLAGLTRRLDERLTLSLQGSSARFRTLPDGSSSSRTDSLVLGLSQAGADASVGVLSLGHYRTLRSSRVLLRVCPLPPSFCDAGLAEPLTVQGHGRSQEQGWQFSASHVWRTDERGDLRLAASRALAPAGVGVVARSDTFNLQASRALGEQLSVLASADLNRVVYPGPAAGGSGARPQLGVLALVLSARLAENLSLQVGAQARRLRDPQGAARAQSNGLWISLAFEPPRRYAQR